METACLTTVSPHSLRDHKKYSFWVLPLAECIGRGSSCARFPGIAADFSGSVGAEALNAHYKRRNIARLRSHWTGATLPD